MDPSQPSSLDLLDEFFVSAQERARIEEVFLGAAAESPLAASELQQLLAFWVADEEYAVDIGEIQEIIKVPAITPVPRVDACVLGVASLRGTIVPILDLRRVLQLEERPLVRQARVLVLRAGGEPVGLLVDRVTSVVRLDPNTIEPTPATMQRGTSDMVVGVGRLEGDRLLINLDVAAVLSVLERAA